MITMLDRTDLYCYSVNTVVREAVFLNSRDKMVIEGVKNLKIGPILLIRSEETILIL